MQAMEDGPPKCASVHDRGCWICQKQRRLAAERSQIRRNYAIHRNGTSDKCFECWVIIELLSFVLELIVGAL
jgi:hypothetical protein